MAPTRCDCGMSVGHHDCVSALKDRVERAMSVQERLLDALHAHHNNDESPVNCVACRKVVNG